MNLTFFLISIAAVVIQVFSFPQLDNAEEQKWEKSLRGWQKPQPCGRPGKPACVPEPTTTPIPTVTPTTQLPTTLRPVPTEPSTTATTKSSEGPPTFGTTSVSEVTSASTLSPTTTSRRPLSTPAHDGGMVFPVDDEEEGPDPVTKPPRPQPTTAGSTTMSSTTMASTSASTTSSVTTPGVDGDKDAISSTTPSGLSDCIQRCPVTPEYNPVCGTDGVTYTNPGRLICAQSCGKNVNMGFRGPCKLTTPAPSTTPAVTTPEIDGNQEAETTTPSSAIRECIQRCPVTPEYNPVCGTNGVTYTNPGRLYCAQHCGIKVDLGVKGPCRSNNSSVSSTTPVITTPDIDGNHDSVSTTPSSVLRECMQKCPVTSEFNPVCGTDGVTYTNPGRLICAQFCGKKVEPGARGPCNNASPEPSSTTPAKDEVTSTTLSPDAVKKCIDRCPVTPEYNPVCGTNRVTYKNLSHFYCAQSCNPGVTLDIERRSRCPK